MIYFLANVNVSSEFTFAIYYYRSVCLLSVVCNVGASYSVEIFGNFYSPSRTLAIH